MRKLSKIRFSFFSLFLTSRKHSLQFYYPSFWLCGLKACVESEPIQEKNLGKKQYVWSGLKRKEKNKGWSLFKLFKLKKHTQKQIKTRFPQVYMLMILAKTLTNPIKKQKLGSNWITELVVNNILKVKGPENKLVVISKHYTPTAAGWCKHHHPTDIPV